MSILFFRYKTLVWDKRLCEKYNVLPQFSGERWKRNEKFNTTRMIYINGHSRYVYYMHDEQTLFYIITNSQTHKYNLFGQVGLSNRNVQYRFPVKYGRCIYINLTDFNQRKYFRKTNGLKRVGDGHEKSIFMTYNSIPCLAGHVSSPGIPCEIRWIFNALNRFIPFIKL